MRPCMRPDVLWVCALLVLALWLPGKVSVWIDAEGRPVLSNRAAPESARVASPAEIAASWRGKWEAEPLETPTSDPVLRELAVALDDLRQGEQGRALDALRRLTRAFPARSEAHWVLARVEFARGRHTAALESLDAALSVASEMPEGWRAEAESLRTRIRSEIAHAATLRAGEATPFIQDSANFRLFYDHPFAGRGYGDAVLVALERIRLQAAQSLGRSLSVPLDVRMYTKADYVQDYGHRFAFGTVGFYDGAIHVVAARHPERRLLALLAHEYTHALFFDAVGGHRPFFLNEGMAEREEGRLRGRERLARGEWRRLLDALRDRVWIPLPDLVEAFNRLDPQRVPLAYLQGRAAVELLDDREPGTLARWLERCAKGQEWQGALQAETGWTLQEFDRALRESVEARFPSMPEALGAKRSPEDQRSKSFQSSKSTAFARMYSPSR